MKKQYEYYASFHYWLDNDTSGLGALKCYSFYDSKNGMPEQELQTFEQEYIREHLFKTKENIENIMILGLIKIEE